MDKIVLSGFADEISSSLDRQIQVLKKLGISHMEIRGVEKKGIDTYTTEEVKEIKGKLDDQGIATRFKPSVVFLVKMISSVLSAPINLRTVSLASS